MFFPFWDKVHYNLICQIKIIREAPKGLFFEIDPSEIWVREREIGLAESAECASLKKTITEAQR